MNNFPDTFTSIFIWLFDGPASHLWPMLIIPSAAALISDRAAGKLPPTRADWRTAAMLAATPGLAMLTIMGMIFVRALRHTEADKDLAHFTQYQATAIIAGAWLGVALLRAARRQRQLQRLTRLASLPSPRLARAGAQAKIAARELPGQSCEMFVAGLLRPIVYVSRGALDRMGDEELTAALHHERAHVRGRDPAMYSLLAFLQDLAPNSRRAETAFIHARERLADAHAARCIGSLALASALIAAVKPLPSRLPVPGIGGTGAAEWRLRAILGVEPAEGRSPRSSMKVRGGVALNLMLAAWPAGHIYIAYQLCC